MARYGFAKMGEVSFAEALERVRLALQDEGFGVLSDIDVAATLKTKLKQDIPPYRILGACHPEFASRALAAEPMIGLLLPCNVVVREDESGLVHVEFMDPGAVLELTENPAIHALAGEVRERLERVMRAV